MNTRILVFDDDEATCTLLMKALSAKGYEVQTFNSPKQFPFAYKQQCPCPPNEPCADIIIADIVMPEMGGIEFLKKLKDSGCLPVGQGNVVVISGYLTLQYMTELNDLGIHYFRKPFRLEDIYAWVEKCNTIAGR